MKNEGLELVSDGFYYETQYDSIDTVGREADIIHGKFKQTKNTVSKTLPDDI